MGDWERVVKAGTVTGLAAMWERRWGSLHRLARQAAAGRCSSPLAPAAPHSTSTAPWSCNKARSLGHQKHLWQIMKVCKL